MTAIRLEAENMTLNSGYVIKERTFADNNQLIHLTELTGKATTAFNGNSGTYDVTLSHFDESDGQGTVKLTIGNNQQTILLNQNLGGSRPSANNQVQTTVFQGLQINPGDNIEIAASMDGGEVAAIDWLEFSPVIVDTTAPTATLQADNFNTNLNSTDTYTFTVTFADNEAVNVSSLNNAITVQDGNGVNQAINFVQVNNNTNGSPRVATYQLNAPGGSWDTNEAGSYTISVVGNTVVDTSGNALGGGNLGSFEVNVQSPIPNTFSYKTAQKPIIARLDQDFGIELKYDRPIKLMPLGDSITQGKIDNNEDIALRSGYRNLLETAFDELGLKVDFVGSEYNGKPGFDNDHQGHSGWNINQITFGRNGNGGVEVWLPDAEPDMVLLMIGTNDSGGDNAYIKMIENLDTKLIPRIFNNLSSDAELIISSIPPVSPESNKYETRIANITTYNEAIPGIVDKYDTSGENISFVDIWSGDNAITENDISTPPDDNGLHPTAGGYEKMANFYYEAVLDVAGTQTDLNNISNIIGSDFDDVIVGNNDNNEILGGEGDDELTGGGGADTFIYTKLADGEDMLTDFNPTEGDIFQINASGFVGSGLTANTPLSNGTASATGVFVSGENPQAVGNSANILYNTNTGILSMDIDGVGAQTPLILATLEGAPGLSVDQFEIA